MKQQQQLSLLDFPEPVTLTAERQVLTDLTANPNKLPDVMEIISADLFSIDDTRKIWETMVAMFNNGERIDAFTLRSRCGKSFTEHTLLAVREVGTELDTIQHAIVLRDEAARRRAYFAGCWLMEKATKPGGSEDEMVEAASTIADRFQKRSARGDMGMAEVMDLVGEDV